MKLLMYVCCMYAPIKWLVSTCNSAIIDYLPYSLQYTRILTNTCIYSDLNRNSNLLSSLRGDILLGP